LQVDSLVCFVSSNGKIIFLSVCDPLPFHGRKDSNSDDKRRLDDIPSLFRQANRASVLLSLAEYKTEDAIWISTHIAPSKTRQSLVEFPGVLLPSFQPTLQALQKMSRKLSLPFAEIVALDSQTSAAVIKPPAYATKRGFSFNLDVLAGVPLTLKPGQSFDFHQAGRRVHARRSPTIRRHPSSQYRTSSHPRPTKYKKELYRCSNHQGFTPQPKGSRPRPHHLCMLHESCSRSVVRAFSEGWCDASHPSRLTIQIRFASKSHSPSCSGRSRAHEDGKT
jgi:hypothetical protein